MPFGVFFIIRYANFKRVFVYVIKKVYFCGVYDFIAMTIKSFYFNPYREATYIVQQDFGNRSALIVDAGMYDETEQTRFAAFVEKQGLRPVALLITHAHPDHVCGADFLRRTYGVEPIVFPPEGMLTIPDFNGISVLRTPGHKEDSVCYYWEQEHCVFTGDTLFAGAVGRTDLPGGDMETLRCSLRRLLTLPESTVVYPGHGLPTTIGEERYNLVNV